MEGLRDYIEVGLDTCKFTDNELTVTAIIKAVSANSLTVKPISRMGKNVYESNLDTTFKEMFLPRSSFFSSPSISFLCVFPDFGSPIFNLYTIFCSPGGF